MSKYLITFEQNGGEYVGWLKVDCDKITRGDDDCTFYADDIKIEIDEKIIEIDQLTNERKGLKNERTN